jgi:hypothetical protein
VFLLLRFKTMSSSEDDFVFPEAEREADEKPTGLDEVQYANCRMEQLP